MKTAKEVLESLTFGEVVELLNQIEKEHPNAEKTELVSYAYAAGYEAAQKERA